MSPVEDDNLKQDGGFMEGKANNYFYSRNFLLSMTLDGKTIFIYRKWSYFFRDNPDNPPQIFMMYLLFKIPCRGTVYTARSAQKTSLLDVLLSHLNERLFDGQILQSPTCSNRGKGGS
jgi:hypothetical protein